MQHIRGDIMSFTVINLSTNEKHTYDDNVSKIQAVCTSYCTSEALSSWFFSLLHNGMDYTETLPICNGSKSIACGDWTAIK